MRDFTRVVIVTLIVLLIVYVFKITRIGREPVNLLPNITYAVQFLDEVNMIDDVEDLLWLNLSSSPYRTKHTNYIWYKIPMPIIEEGIGIYFSELKTNEYLLYGSDGKLLASDSVNKFSYNRFAFVKEIPKTYSSKTLYLRVTTNVHFDQLTSAVYIGDYDTLNDKFNNYNLIDVVVGALFLTAGVVMMLLSFFFKKKQRVMNISLGGFLINVGLIIMLNETNFIYYFSDLHDFLHTLYIMNVLIIPLTLIYFYESAMVSKKSSKGVTITKSIFMIYTTLTILSLFLLKESSYIVNIPFTVLYNYMYPVLISLLGIVLIVISFIESNEQRIYARIYLNGLLMFLIALIVNFAFNLIVKDKFITPAFWKAGTVMLSINLVSIAINQMIIYRRAKFTTSKLQVNNALEYDYLTSLPNQIGILRQLDLAIRNHQVTGDSFTCAMINIDNLGLLNKRYGYIYGDDLIVSLVGLCYEHFGKDIVLGRYSDAIFFVLLPSIKRQKAYHLLESFREKVKFSNHTYSEQMVHYTISISLMEHQLEDDMNQLIYKLNQAMYFAKNHGKDVCIEYSQVTGT